MKKIFWLCTRPLYWLWKILSTGLSVLSSLVFFAVIALMLTAALYEPEVNVPSGCALLLTPEGAIVEQRSPIDPATRLINQLTDTPLHEETYLQDILDTIEAAADDPRIRILIVNINRMGTVDLDQIQTIGRALEHFKATGKKVIALGDRFNQAQYYLASWANAIYLNPMGAVNLRGFSIHRLYYKELLEKLAIDMHVFRVGTFKSAVEPLLRNSMSAEDRAANILWLNSLWNVYSTDICANRNLNPDMFKENINQMTAQLAEVGGYQAEWALKTGLVDGLKTRQELEALFLAEVGSAKNGQDFNHIDFRHYLQTMTPSYTSPPQGQDLIGIITAEGNILPGEGAVGQIGAEELIKKIRHARKNPHVKAIVLRINTGGGSAFASEQIRQELVQTQKEGKVVVVSMGAMTASGGYWLAANADSIVAASTTLTGSIGIFGAIPTVEKSLAKLGIHSDGIGTTDIAQFGHLSTDMSAEEQRVLQMSVQQGYDQFIQIVAQGRKMTPAQVEALAQGRVWDGATAKQLGLVDRLGDLETAIDEAARLAKVDPDNGLLIDLDTDTFLERLKRVEQPAAVKLGHLLPTAAWPAQLKQLTQAPLELLLLRQDPGGLYAHSLLEFSPSH